MKERDIDELGRALLVQLTSCSDKLRGIHEYSQRLLTPLLSLTTNVRALRSLAEARARADGITEETDDECDYRDPGKEGQGERIARALTEITAELNVANEHLEDQTRAMQLWALSCYKSVRTATGPRHDFPTSMPESFTDTYEKLVVKVLQDVNRNG